MKLPLAGKSKHMLDFLREVGQLRQRRVPTVERWESVLWLHRVPLDGREAHAPVIDPVPEATDEVWLEIRKVTEPMRPELSAQLRPWLLEDQLDNASSVPRLRGSITELVDREVPKPMAGADDPPARIERVPTDRYLRDSPEIQEAWSSYLEKSWKPWAESWARWKNLDEAYMTLDAMRRRVEEAGDRHELLLGIGLLQWIDPTGEVVKRHVLTAPAEIHFHAAQGRIEVLPAVGFVQFRIELDMLETGDRPTGLNAHLQPRLEALDPALTDRAALGVALHEIANRVNAQGVAFPEELVPAERALTRLELRFAPAVILRERRPTAFQEVVERILARAADGEGTDGVEIGIDGSAPWNGLINEGETSVRTGTEKDGASAVASPPGRVYFPLPTNEEQRRIIQRHRISCGVLVQGPPGTGKSHTIANLIAHLLAHGERVLVTAQGPRALEVLRKKLPGDLADLCVCQLGASRAEQKDLETSIRKILDRKVRWEGPERDECRLEGLERRLLVAEEELAATDRQLREAREAETHPQELPGGYRGTAALIARRLAEERGVLGWLGAAVPARLECVIGTGESEELARRLPALTTEELADLDAWSGPGELVAPAVFEAWVVEERRLTQYRDGRRSEADEHRTARCRLLDRAGLDQHLDLLARLDEAEHALGIHLRAEGRGVLRDAMSGHAALWSSLHGAAREELEAVEELDARFGEVRVTLADSADLERIEDHCARRLEHFRTGGGRGFLFLKPRVLRETKEVESCLVRGQSCRSVEQLEQLAGVLELRRREACLWEAWTGRLQRDPGEPRLRRAALRDAVDAMYIALQLGAGAAEQFGRLVFAGRREVEPLHDAEERAGWRTAFEAVRAERNLQEARIGLVALEAGLGTPEGMTAHPSIEALRAAVKDRSPEGYRSALVARAELLARQERRAAVERTLAGIRTRAPRVEEALRECFGDQAAAEQLRDLPRAWAWSAATAWLEGVLSADHQEELVHRTHRLREEIEEITAEIASVRAWSEFLGRIDEQTRMDLVAWQEAIQKIGRGTGIRAAHFRGVARRYLSSCLQAVPAWVMPLYKVWESVDPRPGLFDTIIVDEASQCGLDSLLLLYLAKRIIVVGDKMQVSPTLVGVREDDILALGREHLREFRYRDVYRPDQSLYHHAERAFGNVVALREHFRCVPEIIRFSNDLCYRDNPLIPLRQYPADRLDPVRHTHVNGLREGSGQRVINRIEAERVVEAIASCLEDERYEDCSFGVIELQGHAQAELIARLLVDRISPEVLEERHMRCGDPTTFQGDERDVVFLSMVAAPNERNQTLTSDVYVQRYNVAMSRARDQIWLFHSVEPSDLGADCLRRRLINYFRDPIHATEGGLGLDREALERAAHCGRRQPGLQPSPFGSWFEVDVALELLRRRFRVQPQFNVCGYWIDLVVQGPGAQLAVECDGDYWHGAERYSDDMARQRQLERAGWRFVRVRESAFYANRGRAMEGILRACEDLSIFPLLAGGSETTLIDERSSAAADTEPGIGTEFLTESALGIPPLAERPEEAADSEGIRETDGAWNLTLAGGSAGFGDGASDDEASEDTRDDASSEPKRSNALAVGPFTGYGPESGHPDPRQANRADVRRLIYAIVERDGPLSRAALYRLYGEGCPHVQRVGKVIRGELDAAIAALLRSKSLIQDDELGDRSKEGQIIRLPDQRPSIRLAGCRHLHEIPPSEIGLVLERAHPAPGNWTRLSDETLARKILEHYQMMNLTRPRRAYLAQVFDALRSGHDLPKRRASN